MGNRTDSVTTPDGTTSSTYDVASNLIQIASPQGTVHYTYDPVTGRKTEVLINYTDVVYHYNFLGRLDTVTTVKLDGATLSTPLVATYTYDKKGNLLTTTLPNGTVETRAYDALGRLSTLTNTDGSGHVITSYTYLYDDSGHRTSVQEVDGSVVKYAYDALYRLTCQRSCETESLPQHRNPRHDEGCEESGYLSQTRPGRNDLRQRNTLSHPRSLEYLAAATTGRSRESSRVTRE